MSRWLWIAATVAACATVGATAGALVALSRALDTEPLAPYGFDDVECPDVMPEWMD